MQIEEEKKASLVKSWFNKKFVEVNALPPIIYSDNKKLKLRAKYHSLGKMSDIVIQCDNCLDNIVNLKQFAIGITDRMRNSKYQKEKDKTHKEEIDSRKVVLLNQYARIPSKEQVKEKFKLKRVLHKKDLDYRNRMKEKFGIILFQDQDAELNKKGF